MGKINLQKVIIGGLIAGLVLNIVDYVLYNMILKQQLAAAMTALGKPPVGSAQAPYFVALDFVTGIFLVWLYAAIRPRFGAGPATAVKAGLALWFVAGFLGNMYMWAMGIMPQNLILVPMVVMLVSCPLAGVLGAKFYTEASGMGAGMGAGSHAGMGSRM
jgi:uncharacterized membrane protein